jgi:hypothetical protein
MTSTMQSDRANALPRARLGVATLLCAAAVWGIALIERLVQRKRFAGDGNSMRARAFVVEGDS